MPSLIIVVDGRPVTSHPLPEGVTRVGRSRLNDLRLLDERASRFHFSLRRAGDENPWSAAAAG